MWDSGNEVSGKPGAIQSADALPLRSALVQSGFFVAHLLENPTQLLAELRKFLLHNLPHDCEIHAEVFMDKLVAHAGEASPRDVWLSFPQLVRHILHSLTDDLQVAYDSILSFFVLVEIGPSLRRVVQDACNRVSNVSEVDTIILQSGTASAKTLARKYGLIPPSVITSTFRPSKS